MLPARNALLLQRIRDNQDNPKTGGLYSKSYFDIRDMISRLNAITPDAQFDLVENLENKRKSIIEAHSPQK